MPMISNYEAALKAERKKVVRCFERYSSEQRANHAAGFRLGYQQRHSVGEFYYVHPEIPNIAFKTRKQAAVAALEQHQSPQSEGNMNIEKMSTEGAVQTVNEIADGLKQFVGNNPDAAKELLVALIGETLEPLAEDDFFGTEGWEHAFGIED